MSLAAIYLFLALLCAICTLTAIVKARRLYWLVPVYFMLAWLCGELALIHLLWQVALTAVLAFTGVCQIPLAQTGLGFLPCPGWAWSTCTVSPWTRRSHLRRCAEPGAGGELSQRHPVERQRVL